MKANPKLAQNLKKTASNYVIWEIQLMMMNWMNEVGTWHKEPEKREIFWVFFFLLELQILLYKELGTGRHFKTLRQNFPLMVNHEWIGFKMVGRNVVLALIPERLKKTALTSKFPKYNGKIFYFSHKWMQYFFITMFLFHTQCFISDSLLASEDELPIEDIQRQYLFLDISRKFYVRLMLMVFNLKKDLQLLNFALITADNR